MKVILKPVSYPRIGEIIIEDTLFPIGRNEKPFSSQDGDAVSKLSRRHARIFQEDGKVYIADTGSLNGTWVNNEPVKKDATVLQAGDEINLGGEMTFQVEIEDDVDETRIYYPDPQPTPVLLLLVPVDKDSGIETIVVSSFPFLITRTDSVFGRYKERYPDDVGQISRRQAVISLRGNDVYLEDLGSVNGTYISDVKLDEHARMLADGDVIAFGGNRFSYTVRLQKAEQGEDAAGTILAVTSKVPADTGEIHSGNSEVHTETGEVPAGTSEVHADIHEVTGTNSVHAGSDETSEPVDESRTTFVNSATSFLDIYCTEDDVSDVDDNAGNAGGQRPDSAAASSGKPAGRMSKTRALVGEFRDALDDGTRVDRRKIWAGAVVVAIGLIAAIAIYFLDIDRREIKELLDAGAYAESAVVGERYLKKHPDDDEAGAWALEALLKATVPDWVEYVELGQFDEASALLATASQNSQSIQHGQEMLDMLDWAGRVEAHIADRGGSNAPIVFFRHEQQIKELVEQWNADPARHQQLISQLATQVPAFEPVQTRVLSELRMLRNENSLYGKAIAELKSAIKLGLRNKDYEKIYSSINEFSTKYPRVTGLKELKEDAAQYEIVARYVDQQDLAAVIRFRHEIEFQTPLFKEQVNEWLDSVLPPANIIAQYEEAADAWRVGNGERAIEILEPLTPERWGDVAARQIEQHKRVDADFQALQSSKESEDYRKRLIAFRSSLDPSTDEYFLRAIETDFGLYKDQSVSQLEQSLIDARQQWNDYRSAGGIPGVVRVEERVSERFTTQAKRLLIAYELITEGTQVYQIIRVTPPAEWQTLREEIENEAKRQRTWLQDLGLVLDPALLKAKLDLLPQIKEAGQ